MTYESAARRSRAVRAPEVPAEGRGRVGETASEAMIGVLSGVDRRTRLSIRALQAVYVLMIAGVASYAVAEDDSLVQAALGLFALAFVLVVVAQQLRYRAYSQTYVGVPTIEYLRRAKERMRVFTVRTWLAVPTWLLIDAGLCLIVYRAAGHFEIPVAPVILGLQLVVAMAIALDFLSEYLIWRRAHQPVVAEIDRMLGEIEASLAADG